MYKQVLFLVFFSISIIYTAEIPHQYYEIADKDLFDFVNQQECPICLMICDNLLLHKCYTRKFPRNFLRDTKAYQLAEQYQQKTEQKRRYFVCKECSREVPTRSKLCQHLLTHTGEKPYKCLHCTQAFSKSGDLNTHAENVHGVVDKCRTELFLCCDLTFRFLSGITDHIENEHELYNFFLCKYCSRSFRELHNLIRHRYDVHDEIISANDRKKIAQEAISLALDNTDSLPRFKRKICS